MNVIIEEDYYKISFNYHIDKVIFCKQLQSARYLPKEKVWKAPRNIPNALELNSAGYFRDDAMLSLKPEAKRVGAYQWKNLWQESIKLYKHQEEWRMWCRDISRGMLVAEVGLGKTLMTMLWWSELGLKPDDIFIICPNTLTFHWEQEIRALMGESANVIAGSPKKRKEAMGKKGIHIVNYEYLLNKKQMRPELLELKKTCIILEESHSIKNPSAERSKLLHKYCKDKSHVLLLTGTPVSQGAQDYYSQFKCIDPKLLGASYSGFKDRYCVEENIRGAPPGIRKIVGYKRIQELTDIIAPYMFSRLQKDCLDLPNRYYVSRYVELAEEQRKIYNEMKNDMITFVEENKTIAVQNILTKLLVLSQITQGFLPTGVDKLVDFPTNPKLSNTVELIDSLPEQESVIIVCRFLHDIELLYKTLSKTYKVKTLQGETPVEDRKNIEQEFQRGEFKILIGQVRVIGVGLTLTRANKMIFYSNDYSLINREQAEGRIHRISQTQKCTYIDIIAKNTVDEPILRALKSKADVAEMLYNFLVDK